MLRLFLNIHYTSCARCLPDTNLILKHLVAKYNALLGKRFKYRLVDFRYQRQLYTSSAYFSFQK